MFRMGELNVTEGQTLYHKDGRHQGEVVEVADGRVYLTQDNGVEIDFALEDMRNEPPAPVKSNVITHRVVRPDRLLETIRAAED